MRRMMTLVLLIAAACSAETTPSSTRAPATTVTSASSTTSLSTTTEPPTTPPEDRRPLGEFHIPPAPLPEGSPGDVLWVEELPAPGESTAWNVLYLSTGMDGAPIATSGWVARSGVPGPHPVLAFAHGTTGLGDECAPTVSGSISPFLFRDFLDAGWTVAFTDYQGLGTPGLHHYLVAEPTARSVLDAVRAARQLDDAATMEVALFGFSQGGHAALWATELAPVLAPELEVTHTVAAAPAVDLRGWLEEAPRGQLGYLAMIGAGYTDAYHMALEEWFGPEVIDRIDAITDGCLLDIEVAVSALDPSAVVPEVTPGTTPGDLLEANEPATTLFPTPLLLLTGGEDDLFTREVTTLFLERLCDLGIDVDHIEFPEASHIQVGSLGRASALEWILSDRASASSAC